MFKATACFFWLLPKDLFACIGNDDLERFLFSSTDFLIRLCMICFTSNNMFLFVLKTKVNTNSCSTVFYFETNDGNVWREGSVTKDATEYQAYHNLY